MPDLIVNTEGLIGVRFTSHKFGKTKTCTKEEKAAMTKEVHAQTDSIRASKVIIRSNDPTIKKLDTCHRAVRSYITAYSQPSIIDGIRHVNQDKITDIISLHSQADQRQTALKLELKERKPQLMADAQDRLGDFYSDDLFPTGFENTYSMVLDFPKIEPDERLKKLDPAAYEAAVAQYLAQVTAKASEALDTLLDNTAELVNRMVEILTGDEDGKVKTFRKDTFDSWALLFDRFKSITSVMEGDKKDKAEAIVDAAEDLLEGITPKKLRNDATVQGELKQGFQQLQAQLMQMVETQGRFISLDDDDDDEIPEE